MTMSDARKRAACYARQSHGKATSIEDQIREAHATCEREGWAPLDYGDRVSASRFGSKERDDWSQLVTDVSAGKLDIIVLWDSSRGDRTPSTWTWFLERCRKHSVCIYVIRDRHLYDLAVPRDWKTLHDSGTDAAYESEIKSVDVRRGVAGAAMAGKPHGSPPRGYDRVYDQNDRKVFTQVPNGDAWIPIEVITRIAKRDPIVHIQADLARRGVHLHRNVIRKTALNASYAGLRSHNGTLHPGNWEPLVTEEAWRAACAVLADPKRKTTQPGKARWMLSYIATCAACSGQLQGVNGKGRRDLYHCVAKGCVSIGMWELDGLLTGFVCERLSRKDARAVFAVDDKVAAVARKRVRGIKAELDDLAVQVEKGPSNGGISASLAAKSEPGILKRLADAEAELKRHTRHGALMALLDADNVHDAWDEMLVAGKRSVVTALFTSIKVSPADERLSRWSSDEDRMRLAAERTSVTWA